MEAHLRHLTRKIELVLNTKEPRLYVSRSKDAIDTISRYIHLSDINVPRGVEKAMKGLYMISHSRKLLFETRAHAKDAVYEILTSFSDCPSKALAKKTYFTIGASKKTYSFLCV